MNLISRILPSSNVLIDLPASSKKRAFEQADCCLKTIRALPIRKYSTACLRVNGLDRPAWVKALRFRTAASRDSKSRLRHCQVAAPIQFDAPDGQPVSLMIFLLVPEQASQQHLDILSELTQMLSDKPFRESLLSATDAHAVHVALTSWEPIRPAA